MSLCVQIYMCMYMHHPFAFFVPLIMLTSIPYEAANLSTLTCMHDCNFADEVCVWVMSTLLWTCPQNRGHMDIDGLTVGSISCYFMLQITNLGVCKCILCLCVMFLHTPCVYFRL